MRPAIFGKEEFKPNREVNWDFSNENTQQHTHSIHPYPARFIPQIPRLAIMKWSKEGDVVLDPFCGCGTTLVEAINKKRNAIGIDNNAVAVLVSKAKTNKYRNADIESIQKFVDSLDKNINTSKKTTIPEYPNMRYWFDKKAIDELGAIKYQIDKLKEPSKTFALSILSAIIVRISNQDSDTRYVRVKKKYERGESIAIYKRKLLNSLERLRESMGVQRGLAEVHLFDSRRLPMIKDCSVTLIITSPPYLNTYDYHKYHRHRLHWIDGDISLARDMEIGKHDYFTRPQATPEQYFIDILSCFREWKRVLKPGGRILIVVGDAIVGGKPVAVGNELVKRVSSIGFNCKSRWIRKLNVNKKSFNRGARITEEHVILFKK